MAVTGGVSVLLDSGGRIKAAAGACEQLLGRPGGDLIGTGLAELAIEREQEGVRRILESVAETGLLADFVIIPRHEYRR